MAKKNIIKSEFLFKGVLFGISATLKDFQLCWQINRKLNIDLVKQEDIKIINRKKNKTSFYNLFIFEDEINKWKIYVVSNKHNGEYLMPEIKQSDYFLMVNGEINEIQKTELHVSLKQLNTIQLIVSIELSKIKSNQNLIFD